MEEEPMKVKNLTSKKTAMTPEKKTIRDVTDE
jgi:hypothetical protein